MPWEPPHADSLTANVAAAVNPELTYIRVEQHGKANDELTENLITSLSSHQVMVTQRFIGGVGGSGRRLEPELPLHHVAYLLLGGVAASDDGLLDLPRRVLGDRHVERRPRLETRRAARLDVLRAIASD